MKTQAIISVRKARWLPLLLSPKQPIYGETECEYGPQAGERSES